MDDKAKVQKLEEAEGILNTMIKECMTGKLNLSFFAVDMIRNTVVGNIVSVKDELKKE